MITVLMYCYLRSSDKLVSVSLNLYIREEVHVSPLKRKVESFDLIRVMLHLYFRATFHLQHYILIEEICF